jgi:formylglycine-generating enzyme required for sulfatase activity
MKKFIIYYLLFLLIFSFFQMEILSEEVRILGKIQSVRNSNIVTFLSKKKPDKLDYLIFSKNAIIGKIKILHILKCDSVEFKYKIISSFVIKNKNIKLQAGDIIGLEKDKNKYKRDFSQNFYNEKIRYQSNIITRKDNREMILIPSGKFIFGSNHGDKDEYPEQILDLKNYYIDKYEVSNKDFKKFIDSTDSPYPKSWGGRFADNNLPVLVTYIEAEKYSKWAGKRLPTEVEWEKAARGSGSKKLLNYPWGENFYPNKANSMELWNNKSYKDEIKSIFNVSESGLLPVDSFKRIGLSPFGIVNMAGNVYEWTSSWYQKYNGNIFTNKKYGYKYKVIRGGAWFSNKLDIRSTNREIGGIPNIFDDNFFGFRCIMDVRILDKIVR